MTSRGRTATETGRLKINAFFPPSTPNRRRTRADVRFQISKLRHPQPGFFGQLRGFLRTLWVVRFVLVAAPVYS